MYNIKLRDILVGLNKEDDFVFLETKRITAEDHRSYLFTHPLYIIKCNKAGEVKPALDKIEKLIRKGLFAAGFLSYEAGFAFEEAIQPKRCCDFPLLWFGIYEKPVIFDHYKIKFNEDSFGNNYVLSDIKPTICEIDYIKAIKRIRSYIEEGQTYQVNYTFKLNFSFYGSIHDLYLNLRQNQSVSYSAFIRFKEKYIISFSPELFFRKRGDVIQVRPMKGTASRGRYLNEDIKNTKALKLCPKNKSENIMIVDLLRNDLGKVSKIDTVNTKSLFDVEGYESLLQMTSTVEGKIKKNTGLYDLFTAIFPSGSVTGAPKIRTMQIIDELEQVPRRIYTGSIGFINPENDANFNVAIRTLLIDTQKNTGEMGVGSGIVYDSDAKKEYDECFLKADFLTKRPYRFELIETILWQPNKGCFLLGLHLKRLTESAEYFNFSYDKKVVIKSLKKIISGFDKDKEYRMRLLLSKDGRININVSAIEYDDTEKLITFSNSHTLSSDLFLFHKTTNRDIYDREYQRYRREGFYDIIFHNEKGEITEGAISNIFIRKDSIYYTPPLKCGLLNGVYRSYLIQNKNFKIIEKILYREDIERADEILLTNAVRGIKKVKLLNKRLAVHTYV